MGAQTHKRALAGKYLLEGDSLKKALIKAGYAETTSSKPTANGLTAERCIAEAVKQDPTISPTKLVQGARKAVAKLLSAANSRTEDELWRSRQFGALVRAFEAVERWHGHRVDDPRELDARQFAERVRWLQKVQAELARLDAKREGSEDGDSPGPPVLDLEVGGGG